MYVLQNRWVLEHRSLIYYGLRNQENLFRNRIKLSRKQAEIVAVLPKELNETEKQLLKAFLGEQIVLESNQHQTPSSIEGAVFCTQCVANNYIIPGLEFDEQGRCPMCQTAKDTEKLKSIVPLLQDIPHSKHSRFDVGLFYTGGKDSTFMLHHLSNVKGLRVLAMTWEIPFMSGKRKKEHRKCKKAIFKCGIYLSNRQRQRSAENLSEAL